MAARGSATWARALMVYLVLLSANGDTNWGQKSSQVAGGFKESMASAAGSSLAPVGAREAAIMQAREQAREQARMQAKEQSMSSVSRESAAANRPQHMPPNVIPTVKPESPPPTAAQQPVREGAPRSQGFLSSLLSPAQGVQNVGGGNVKVATWWLMLLQPRGRECVAPGENIECSGKGFCLDGDKGCKCKNGFVGKFCEIQCPGGGNCNDRGVCLEDGKCLCQKGFSGEACELRQMVGDFGESHSSSRSRRRESGGPCGENNECSGHGRCLSGEAGETCKCEPGWSGQACSTPCPGLNKEGMFCSGFGSCTRDGKCRCDAGYWGEMCEKGMCGLKGTCKCEEGWTGLECKEQVGKR
ncbi:hypothetical protein GUITHDRAFT_142365 [Guillardia theta CCMP2712]|uniref:EGF-like domain-containing protein n=1 Tax=Guillardia theta (strain CCMP2712) TaxID=905079 RepID=L1IYR2_GUITC|nr:hypothetical protein GUITHDRAFT_142365 [Guillardia theta CCMP2712]EKX40965.1 hypothetical protein GUITHDRAFT_142365 [Guillardia theta CCMP2712]|eukprot:XP_005827945.1 hypothetical protein GUITHDRAFT_142365 [Guillardia theta CCMP2712]